MKKDLIPLLFLIFLARHKFKDFALNPTDVTPNKISVKAMKK